MSSASQRRYQCQLALVFQLVLDPDANEISVEATELALRWVTGYLDEHAKRVYNLAQRGGEGAYQLASGIQGGLASTFTVRDVRNKHWGGLSVDPKIQEAISALAESGWVREATPTDATGRPAKKFEINPRIPPN